MKKIIILVFMFSFASCEIQYDAETKLVVETKLIDQLGNPIPNQEIRITARSEYGFLSSSSDLISNGRTNSQGESLLIFPAPKGNEVFLDIIINGYSFENNSDYQVKGFYNIKTKNFNNYKLNLNPIILYKNNEITNLILFPTQINNNNRIQNISIIGTQPIEFINYNNPPNQEPLLQTQYLVLKNNIATIKYDVLNLSTNTTSTITLDIPIASIPVNQIINY